MQLRCGLMVVSKVRKRTGAFSSFSRKGSEKGGGLAFEHSPKLPRSRAGAVLWLGGGGSGQGEELAAALNAQPDPSPNRAGV